MEVSTANDAKQTNQCPHIIKLGKLAVYVRDSCPHKKLIKGVYVVTGRMCKGCEMVGEQHG